MKKLFPIQFILIISLFLFGVSAKMCRHPFGAGEFLLPAPCNITTELYEGAVSVAKNGDTDIEITSPEGLAGLKLLLKETP